MAERPSRIFVLAGTNGAGKSSVVGAMLEEYGAVHFDPDLAARRIRQVRPGLSVADANSAAWHVGKRLLESAIEGRLDFAIESTLGARTIPNLLIDAARRGIEVRIWYIGLGTPELHIARVRARVRKGGHDIPESDIRRRWDNGRRNVIALLPVLTELRVYDNSLEADPDSGVGPEPILVLHLKRGKIVAPRDLSATPEWAKPIVAAALRIAKWPG